MATHALRLQSFGVALVIAAGLNSVSTAVRGYGSDPTIDAMIVFGGVALTAVGFVQPVVGGD